MNTKLEKAYGRLSKALMINTQPAIIERCKREAVTEFKKETGVNLAHATAMTIVRILREHNRKAYPNG